MISQPEAVDRRDHDRSSRGRPADRRGRWWQLSLFGKLRSEKHLPGFDGATGWLNSRAADPGRPARQGRPRQLLDVHLHQLAAHARLRPRVGMRSTKIKGWSLSASTRRSSPSSTTPTTSAGPRRTCASSIRSRSTLTSRSGVPSTTTTGRPCTSPTPKGGSGTTTSARVNTRSRDGRPGCCFARQAARASATLSRSPTDSRLGRLGDPGVPETYLGYGRRRTSCPRMPPSSTSLGPTACRTGWSATSGRCRGTGRSGRERRGERG